MPSTPLQPDSLIADAPDGPAIIAECEAIRDLLLTKNKAYGSSAFNPIGIFAKGDPVELINARIDDKLSRIKQAKDFSEDTELDLLGYLVLKRIAVKKRAGMVGPGLFHHVFKPCAFCEKQIDVLKAWNAKGRLFCGPECEVQFTAMLKSK